MTSRRYLTIRLSAIATLLAVVIVAASCSSSRNAASAPYRDYSSMSLGERFAAIVSSYGGWKEMNVPMKLEILAPEKMSVSARAYMRHGKDIYVSFRFLGIEVANIYVTNDSIFGTDKINSRYVAEEIGPVLAGADVSVSDIQDLLTGRMFVNGGNGLSGASADEFRFSEKGDTWRAAPRKTIHGAAYSFEISRESNTLEKLDISTGSRNVTIEYSSATETEAGKFMSTANISTAIRDKEFEARIKWNFSNAKWKVDKSVGWKKPRGYTKVNATSLLKLFSSAK